MSPGSANLRDTLAAEHLEVRARLGFPKPKIRGVVIHATVTRDWLFVMPSVPVPADKNMPHWKRILIEVAAKHKIGCQELVSHRRHKYLSLVRYEAMWRMRTETGMSLPAIGKRLGGRDHTTILHGLRRYEEMHPGIGSFRDELA